MSKIGERVIAVSHSEEGKLFIFGAGVYVGDEIPPADVEGFNIGLPNPKIELDNGGVVYGCECWWGSEEKIKEGYKDFEFIETNKEKSNE